VWRRVLYQIKASIDEEPVIKPWTKRQVWN